jgi:MFS transporter, DHA2 family, multidrug resistance protein
MLGTARLGGQTLGATLVAAVFAAYGERDPAGMALGLWVACGLAVLAAVGSVRRLGVQGS